MWDFSTFEKYLSNCCTKSVQNTGFTLLKEYSVEQTLHIMVLIGDIDSERLDVEHCFPYGGYHFLSVKEKKSTVSTGNLLEIPFEKDNFLQAYGGNASLFLCVEDGKLYIPLDYALEEVELKEEI